MPFFFPFLNCQPLFIFTLNVLNITVFLSLPCMSPRLTRWSYNLHWPRLKRLDVVPRSATYELCHQGPVPLLLSPIFSSMKWGHFTRCSKALSSCNSLWICDPSRTKEECPTLMKSCFHEMFGSSGTRVMLLLALTWARFISSLAGVMLQEILLRRRNTLPLNRISKRRRLTPLKSTLCSLEQQVWMLVLHHTQVPESGEVCPS